ncbi:MAG: multidrug effflux MFS transporter [Rhodobacteraceae bacterium]|jgi:MFS transporter, DHA1 family, multidrug resistance protein|nr:multidrug effflux MFS transporter [Paracoccaceae bacterium]
MQPVRFLDRTTPPHIATLILVAGLAALSLNIFLPSLTDMAAHFGVEYSLMQLSVAAYLGMTAILQLVIGPISDRFGRRPVLLGATAIFIAATLGALWAPNFTVFMICRLVQATIASGFAIGRAVVRDMVPPEKAASMIGYVTMGMSLVPMVGPAIGGALDSAFGWQGSFWLLAIGGGLVFALLWADLGETATSRSTSFAAQVRAYPTLFRSQRFWAYCLAAATASGAFFAFLGGAPYVGDVFYAMDSATLGAYFAAPAIGYMAGNFASGRFATRIGINRMIMLGALVTTGGLALLALIEVAGFTSPNIFFGFVICVGLGNGIMLPSANAGMLSVRPELAGSAAGLGGAITIGGGAALSMLAGVVLTPTSGPLPLVLIMLASSAASVVCVLWVIRRAKAVGAA